MKQRNGPARPWPRGLVVLLLCWGLAAAACRAEPTMPTAAPVATLLPPQITRQPLAAPTSTAVSAAEAPPASPSPPPFPSPTPTAILLPTATPTATPSPEPAPPTAAPPTQAPASTAAAHAAIVYVGQSAGGRAISGYQFKNGPQHIILVGGIHGGYEWNTILLAYRAVDHFTANPEAVPDSVTLTILPAANPDGQVAVVGREGRFTAAEVAADTVPGRFNANGVDLNRNWDCNWAPQGQWRDQMVSGGTAPFSEPESRALRDFIVARAPAAVVFWHSAANGIFTAGCQETSPASLALAQVYQPGTGYPIREAFTAYEVTGDAGDWLANQGITAITVELRDHERTDWEWNLAGMLAILEHYGRP